MLHPRITSLLDFATNDSPSFPPTLLYNEGWLLRLILDWFSRQPEGDSSLSFLKEACWFSEALMPSAFLPRFRSDPLSESRTHLDGVIGHFSIGSSGKADLSLWPEATQFIALEAKMFSSLSAGTKNVRFFDQAARNVACITEVLRRANRPAQALHSCGFYILAPERQIKQGIFSEQIPKESIHKKVERRVKEYAGEKDAWFCDWFVPTLERIDIAALSWEGIISKIEEKDHGESKLLEEFYARCIHFNIAAVRR